jgi:hypothetical protein
VVAADAVALLSGVNFSSVEKVLVAAHLIKEFSGTDLDTLLNLGDVPLSRVDLYSPEDRPRADATRLFCESVAAHKLGEKFENTLHLRGRFSPRTDD